MIKRNLIMATLMGLSSSLIGCSAGPRDRILLKEYAGHNYCHMKIETDGTDPVRYDRDIVDFYGPCDETSASRDRHMEQRGHE